MTRPRQNAFDLAYLPDLAASEFLVSDCNRNAWNAICNWRRWPGERLALTGPAESGKTHLASIWARETGAGRLHAAELTEERLHRLMDAPAVLVENADRIASLPDSARLEFETRLRSEERRVGKDGRSEKWQAERNGKGYMTVLDEIR